MKVYNEILMIAFYLGAGTWAERSVGYFREGSLEYGWWAILLTVVFTLLGSLNLVYVKLDAKKEAK